MPDCYAPKPDRRPPHGLVFAVLGETFVVAAIPKFTESQANARRGQLSQALKRLGGRTQTPPWPFGSPSMDGEPNGKPGRDRTS